MIATDELRRIVPIAAAHGVDPLFIYTIRRVENGEPGRDFGVLSVAAPTWNAQCAVACNTVAHRMFDYDNFSGVDESLFVRKRERLCLSPAFIQYFASSWAPKGAENDPGGLNANWYDNAVAIYSQLCAAGDTEVWS